MTRVNVPLTASEALPGLRVVHAKGQWWATIVHVEWPEVWIHYDLDGDRWPSEGVVIVPAEALRRELRQP